VFLRTVYEENICTGEGENEEKLEKTALEGTT
jgi:hypothetical protein